MIKRIISSLLTLCLIMSMCGITIAANDTAQVKVMVDGKYVSFKDTSPVNRDGRILVSFSEVLEAMGADVVYDGMTNAVTAKLGNTSINFTTSDSIINVEKDGVKSQVEMDVAPAVINGKAMVPVRYISESLGMNTSWDANYDTVVIIDFDKLTKNIDGQYTILNKIMQLGYDKDKTYNQAGDYIVKATVNSPDDQSVSVEVTSKIDALMNGNDLNMKLDMALEADLSELPPEDALQTNLALEMFKNMKFQIMYNNSASTLYINAGMIGTLIAAGFGVQADADTWFKIDLSKGMSDMPAEFVKIASGDTSSITIGSLLKLILNSFNSYGIDSYDQIAFALDIMSQLISDAAFEVSGTPENPRYDLAINSKLIKDAFVSALTKRPSMLPGALDLLKDTDIDKFAGFDLKSSVVINSQYDYTSTMEIKFNLNFGLLSSVLYNSGSTNGLIDFNMKSESSVPGATTMNFEFSMDMGEGEDRAKITETGDMKLNTVIKDETVITTPPEGAKIIDLSDM